MGTVYVYQSLKKIWEGPNPGQILLFKSLRSRAWEIERLLLLDSHFRWKIPKTLAEEDEMYSQRPEIESNLLIQSVESCWIESNQSIAGRFFALHLRTCRIPVVPVVLYMFWRFFWSGSTFSRFAMASQLWPFSRVHARDPGSFPNDPKVFVAGVSLLFFGTEWTYVWLLFQKLYLTGRCTLFSWSHVINGQVHRSLLTCGLSGDSPGIKLRSPNNGPIGLWRLSSWYLEAGEVTFEVWVQAWFPATVGEIRENPWNSEPVIS